MIKKWLNPLTLSIGLTLVSLYLYSLDLALFELYELKSYDSKVQLRGERPVTDQVVIVSIDEKSLQHEGRWPWPRALMAQLINRLTEAGSLVIGYDIFFPEKDNNVSPTMFKLGIQSENIDQFKKDNWIQWFEDLSNSDKQFAQAIERSQRTVLGYFINFSQDRIDSTKKKLNQSHLDLLDFSQFMVVHRFVDKADTVPIRSIFSVGMSLPELMEAANSAGFVSVFPDVDGVVRWVPLIVQHGEYVFPSLSLQIVHEAAQLPLGVSLYPFGVDKLWLGGVPIPSRENGDFLINYYGPGETFKHISATDVLSGKIEERELANRLVLIGGTAAGTHDFHNTPFGPLFPGLEVHANIIENILQNDFMIRPEWLKVLDLVMIIGSGLLIGIVATYFKPYTVASLLIAGLVGYLSVDFYLFTQKGLWINTVFPVFTQLFVYTGVTLHQYAFEEQNKRFIKKMFSHYLAPTVVNRLIDNPSLLKLGGEEKVLTALFTDIVGFSSFSEKLSAENLVNFLNAYLGEMTDILIKHEGSLDKYDGDAIKAFFGAPVYFDDHAKRACWVCIEMQERLREMRTEWKKAGMPEIYMRVGINTGKIVVGNLGSKTRMNYGMNGDSVNLAARLEGVNKQYGTLNIISESTYDQAKDVIDVRELDLIRVVGRATPVRIYELLGKTGQLDEQTQKIMKYFNQGYELYKNRHWNESAVYFEKALSIDEEDGPSLTYLERGKTFQIHPPPADWDGVFSMKVK